MKQPVPALSRRGESPRENNQRQSAFISGLRFRVASVFRGGAYARLLTPNLFSFEKEREHYFVGREAGRHSLRSFVLG